MKTRFAYAVAALQALLVTFLWSTSFLLLKTGLQDLPPVTFAGLRYALASLCLLPLALRPAHRRVIRQLSRPAWFRLILLGLLLYAITQGARMLALGRLPGATVSLIMSSTTVIVAILGIPLLAERPTVLQWLGILVNLAGAAVYFYPASFPAGQVTGLIAMGVAVVANACASLLGRHINRARDVPALVVTAISMSIGGFLLLAAGLASEPFPHLAARHWAIIVWLAVVNTAFSFSLWNHTLRTLSATASNVIGNTILIQVTILCWLFLGETRTGREVTGLVVAGVGALIAQLGRARVNRDRP